MARWTTRWKPLVGDGSVSALDLQRLELIVEIVADGVAQLAGIDPAGLHHPPGMDVLDEGEQQVLERRIFVAAAARLGEGVVEGLFELTGERRHRLLLGRPGLSALIPMSGPAARIKRGPLTS